MTLENLANIAEIVGVIAVVASLLFVGVQLRQNDKTATAQIHQQVVENYNNMLTAWIDHPHFGYILFTDNGYEKLTKEDIPVFSVLLSAMFRAFENIYFQHEKGYMDTSYFNSYAEHFIYLFHRPTVQRWWNMRKLSFVPGMKEFLENSTPPTHMGSPFDVLGPTEPMPKQTDDVKEAHS